MPRVTGLTPIPLSPAAEPTPPDDPVVRLALSPPPQEGGFDKTRSRLHQGAAERSPSNYHPQNASKNRLVISLRNEPTIISCTTLRNEPSIISYYATNYYAPKWAIHHFGPRKTLKKWAIHHSLLSAPPHIQLSNIFKKWSNHHLL